MKTINLSISGAIIKDAVVAVDGNVLRFKKQKGGERTCTYTTEKDSAELTVTRANELGGKLWFLWAMLFFIISVFGIFNSKYDKRGTEINYKSRLTLGETTSVNLKFNRFKNGERAIECTSDNEVAEEENAYSQDTKTKKRVKILTAVEVLIWLAAVAGAVYLVLHWVIGF